MKIPTKFSRIILVLAVLLSVFKLTATNYYWVGGTGGWSDYNQHWSVSSGGQLYHNRVPSPNDTVIFDSLSFTSLNDTVYADSSILYCYTMKWEIVQGNPVFRNQSSATNTILKIYGSLILDTGVVWQFGGVVRFNTLHAGQRLKSSGITFGALDFSGDSIGEISLSDTLRAGYLNFSSGFFLSKGQTIYCGDFIEGFNNRSSIDLDTSIIFTSSISVYHTSLLFDADSAAFIVSGQHVFCGNQHYGKLVALNGITISDGNQFDTLILNSNSTLLGSNTIGTLKWQAHGAMLILFSGTTQTILDTMIFNGACEGISAIESSVMGNPATISKASGSIFCERILLEDILATGNATFTANNSVLNGTCTGWLATNAPAARNLFWVANDGNWSDTSHWSLSTGGPGGQCAPTPLDAVTFDAQSFSGNDTVYADNSFVTCADMTWTATAAGSSFNQPALLDVYGAMVLDPAMNYSSSSVRLRTSHPADFFQPAGKSFNKLAVYGNGGYDLLGDLALSYLLFQNGDFDANAHMISSGSVTGNPINSSTLLFGGCIVNAGHWSMQSGIGVFSAPQLLNTHYFADHSAHVYDTVVFPNNAILYSNCSFSEVSISGNSIMYGNSTFNKLHFLTPGSLLQFQHGSVQTIITQMDVQSTCASLTMLQSTLAGNAATLFKSSGSIVLNDVIFEDITGTGGGSFIGLNSIATYNVTGWNITPPPTVPLYWVGGTGNWNDPQNWSVTSGGSPGTCVPSPVNDVYFDSLSFTGPMDTVAISIPFTYCRSMDWTGSTGAPSLYSTSAQHTLRIYGSMLLDNNVTANQSELLFRSHSPGETINTNGQPLGYVCIDGFNGTWELREAMQAGLLEIINGTFKTAGEQLNVQTMLSDSSSTRGLELDSSVVYASNWIVKNDNAFTFDAGTSHLNISGSNFYGGSNRKYHEVYFTNAVTVHDADTFGLARFTNMASIRSSCIFDTLFLDNAGYAIAFAPGTNQTINENFYSSADAQRPIGVESSDISGSVTFTKLQDTVCTDFLILRGIVATGGAVFYAGQNSADAGNNSGWQYQSCSPQMVDVWPGDANRDLTDDNLDLLAIGVAFGQSRTPRSNASTNWIAQPSWLWGTLFANTSDITNADCDGDGTVGFSDTTAVLLNYGFTHPARLGGPDSVQSVGLPFYFSVPNYIVQAGDTTSVGIMLGNTNSPATNIYGIAFTVNYMANSIVAGSAWMELNNSWLAPTGYEIHLLKDFPAQNKMELAICRIDHANMSGSGEIARLHFRVDPAGPPVFKCWYSDVTMIDFSETQFPTQVVMGAFQVATSVGSEEIVEQGFNAYPNPTNGAYVIDDAKLSGNDSKIEVMDMSGRILQEIQTNGASSVTLRMEELPAGTYFVRLINEKGIFVERVIRQ